MGEPRLVETVNTGGILALGGLHRFADDLARRLQDQHGQAPFLWLFQTGPMLSIFETPWKNDQEKVASIDALRDTLKSFPDFTSYASILEVWMAAYERGSVRPTARIENDLKNRKSVLMINTHHRDGRHMDTLYECAPPDPNGRIYRKEVKGFARGTGRMFNLFEPPAPLPEDRPRVADA